MTILNDDVFEHILRECSVSGLVNISLVSSHFHVSAMPHLLRTVSLDRNPEQIIGFLDFIINSSHKNIDNEILGLGRYVLTFEDHYHLAAAEPEPYPISTWAPSLTKALALMPNLRSFVIEAEIDDICLHSPDFVATLLARPRLTDIDLWGIGPTATTSFGQAMRLEEDTIRLRKVKYYIGDDIKQLALLKGEGFGSVLFASKEYLEELYFEAADMHNLLIDEQRSRDSLNVARTPVIFPKVVSISLSNCDVHLDALTQSFPSLRNLTFDFEPFLIGEKGVKNRIVSFSKLMSIKGSYKYISSFLQHTTCDNLLRLVIDSLWDSITGEDVPAFLVTRAMPGLKSLHIVHSENSVVSWWKILGQSLPSLNYLAISFETEATCEPENLCIHVPRLMKYVPLVYISILFEGFLHTLGSRASPEVQAMVTEQAVVISYARNIKS
ncbi:hypothetical protein CPB84DRAFT_1784159 [Gymnopilus junonius]|uniref:F-box domain-containing protein n=1 Tax=Gymnopilus junonius TaxID=109634 RepID=A0A9P5NLP3_GYMJU|nr:hypothetical protein CPB84DRAFT_1784159 [Gymnopilus junonius]